MSSGMFPVIAWWVIYVEACVSRFYFSQQHGFKPLWAGSYCMFRVWLWKNTYTKPHASEHIHMPTDKCSNKTIDKTEHLLISVSCSFAIIELFRNNFSKLKPRLPQKPTSKYIFPVLSSWQLFKKKKKRKNGVAKLYIIKFNKLIMIFGDNSVV